MSFSDRESQVSRPASRAYGLSTRQSTSGSVTASRAYGLQPSRASSSVPFFDDDVSDPEEAVPSLRGGKDAALAPCKRDPFDHRAFEEQDRWRKAVGAGCGIAQTYLVRCCSLVVLGHLIVCCCLVDLVCFGFLDFTKYAKSRLRTLRPETRCGLGLDTAADRTQARTDTALLVGDRTRCSFQVCHSSALNVEALGSQV